MSFRNNIVIYVFYKFVIMDWPTYKRQFVSYLKARLNIRIRGAGGNLMVTLNQIMTTRPNKKTKLKDYQMAKSAWYFEHLFEANVHYIVRAAIEFAIVRLIDTIVQPGVDVQENLSKLLMVYYEFFLAQSSFIFLANQQENVQVDPNIGNNFQDYWNFLQHILNLQHVQIEALQLAYFDDTFNATLALLEPQVVEIVHDENRNDGLVRFELIHDAACHMHKHNIRDVYVDMFRIDRRFITANDYLIQANETINNGQPLENPNSYQMEFIANDQYIHHWRITHIEEKKDGRSQEVYYLGSYFKRAPNAN